MVHEMNIPPTDQQRVVIIGAGFAGIALAKALHGTNFQVVIIDRHNYHTFQPLLYQVATGGLEPDNIAFPIRRIFRGMSHILFRMADVQEIMPGENRIKTTIGDLDYDYLAIANGSENNFFNLTDVRDQLMPLKKLTDALDLRSLIMQNLEKAPLADQANEQEELFNVVIVGGGPTGVELAGALAEMKRFVLPQDYPELNFERMNIYLFEAAPELLSVMSEDASKSAFDYLTKMGVRVSVNTMVVNYKDDRLVLKDGGAVITDTVIWCAGVKGATIPGLDPVAVLPNGRLKVDSYNCVAGTENIYAIGDIAAMETEPYPKGHPMLAQVAIQQGRHLGENLRLAETSHSMDAFEYHDKGSMATVGRNKAVVDLPRWKFQGTLAWFVWMFVHLFSLIGFRNKLVTFWNWLYSYLTYDKNLGLIIRPFRRKS